MTIYHDGYGGFWNCPICGAKGTLLEYTVPGSNVVARPHQTHGGFVADGSLYSCYDVPTIAMFFKEDCPWTWDGPYPDPPMVPCVYPKCRHDEEGYWARGFNAIGYIDIKLTFGIRNGSFVGGRICSDENGLDHGIAVGGSGKELVAEYANHRDAPIGFKPLKVWMLCAPKLKCSGVEVYCKTISISGMYNDDWEPEPVEDVDGTVVDATRDIKKELERWRGGMAPIPAYTNCIYWTIDGDSSDEDFE